MTNVLPVENVFTPEAMHMPTQELLHAVQSQPDVSEQYALLSTNPYYGRNKLPRELAPQDVDALIAFAADPESTPSLLVRLRALEVALAPVVRNEAGRLQDHAQDMSAVVPPHFLAKQAAHIQEAYPDKNFRNGNRHLRSAVIRLLEKEQITPQLIFTDWYEFSGTPLEMSDDVPATAMLFLSQFSAGNIDKAGRFAALAPLAQQIELVYEESPLPIDLQAIRSALEWHHLDEYFAFGEDHRQALTEFLAEPSSEKNTYVELLDDLYASAQSLAVAFPPEFSDGVQRGARELLANSLYALNYHFAAGKRTDVALPLHDRPDALPLHLDESEPLQLLRTLNAAMRQLASTVGAPDLQTVRVTQAADYHLYRLVTYGRNRAVYIRPKGGDVYDADMEYGRNGSGVEASLSYVIDPHNKNGALMEVGKHRGSDPDTRISIRLDREGVAPEKRGQPDVRHDPMQEQGTLSLDVGSVLGGENDLGTKIGRFLAWGNQLRCTAVGRKTQLNHVTRHFMPRHGNDAVFAAQMAPLIAYFESRRLDPTAVSEQFLAKLATRDSLE